MRILVTGGRKFEDAAYVNEILSAIHQEEGGIEVLINGGAPGADTLGKGWALANGIPVATYEPDWKKFGKSAGPRRNQRMLEMEKPDLVVAFPGGRGTADMVGRAMAAGVQVRIVPPKELAA